mgnify:FL=1|jgi:hypothetical protein
MNYDTTTEMYEEGTVNFFLLLRESILRQSNSIQLVIDEVDIFNNIETYYGDVKNDKIYTDLAFNNNMVDYNLTCKLKFNENMIRKINERLKKECSHNIIEDYIEDGIENEMIKIKYCSKCELHEKEIM